MAKSKKNISKKNLKRYRDDLESTDRSKLRAIAVKYDVEKDRAPKVLAAGKGLVAEEILKLAEEHKVPFYEDKTLTELLTKLRVEDEIPPQLYTIVAEILAYVYQLDKLAKKKRQVRMKSKTTKKKGKK